MSSTPFHDAVGAVVITWQRREEAVAAVGRLLDLPERPRVVVVDNGSTDGTAGALRRTFPRALVDDDGAGPQLEVVALGHNAGAVGRNLGVARLAERGLRYAAFCDDDTWWDPGSVARAADVLDAHPDVAVLTARIVVEPRGTDDPIVAELRDSPVVPSRPGLPGPALGSFLAGASVVRIAAFQQVGGFSPRLWLGGEEELCAADLAAAGWELCYLPELVVHHRASKLRDASLRRRHGIRNTVWFVLLRRPWPAALRRLRVLARTVPKDATTLRAVGDAVRGLPWVLRERRPLPPHAEARFLALEDAQARSTARTYVG